MKCKNQIISEKITNIIGILIIIGTCITISIPFNACEPEKHRNIQVFDIPPSYNRSYDGVDLKLFIDKPVDSLLIALNRKSGYQLNKHMNDGFTYIWGITLVYNDSLHIDIGIIRHYFVKEQRNTWSDKSIFKDTIRSIRIDEWGGKNRKASYSKKLMEAGK